MWWEANTLLLFGPGDQGQHPLVEAEGTLSQMQRWPEKPPKDTSWFLGCGIWGSHALQSLAAKFSSLWLGAFSLKALEFVGSSQLLTSLAQRVSSSYELDTSVTNTISIHSPPTIYWMSYWAYKTLGINKEPLLLSWFLWRWGRSCYCQSCRGEEVCITQGSYEPYWVQGYPRWTGS